MADRGLLTSFRFEVTLRRSPAIVMGRQGLAGDAQGPQASPSGAAARGFDAGFQEVSGLEMELDVQETHEGGRNNALIRRAGHLKYPPLVLKRGLFYPREPGARVQGELWRWMMDVVDGVRPLPRVDGSIRVMSADGDVRATWTFERGLPAKLRGPELNAKTGEVAIEELTLAHEGLRLHLPGEGLP